MHLRFQRGLTLFICAALIVSVGGCEGWWLEKAAYGSSSAEGEPLRVVVLPKPLTYQKMQQLESGYEFELLQQFALDMGYHLQIKTVRNEKALLEELRQGRSDLGAARWSELSPAFEGLERTPNYDEEKTALVCRQSSRELSKPWKLLLRNSRAEAQWLHQIRRESPAVQILMTNSSSSQVLKKLLQGKADCTLMDHLEAHFFLRVFPSLQIVKNTAQTHAHFFLLAPRHPELAKKIRHWLGRPSLRQVVSHARAHVRGLHQELSHSDIRRFLQARESVFPQYASIFRKHSQSFGIPWQLTAAVAYQESQWNPEAQSFTGVKGLMQLTQETAEHLGVEDRENTEQSIWGGVKYLKLLLDRQPKGLPFREKLALALATYNVGPAHMIDAQKLAQKLGKNPYLWKDLSQVLPLLSEKDYLPELKYGPARGREPVEYVARVFAFLDLISIQI